MKKTPYCEMIALLLLIALFGCAGIQQEQTVKPQEPSPQPAAVAPPPVQPVPDESEMIRGRDREMLLGKWRRQAQGGDTIEFMEDGTVTLYSAVERISYPGSYRILDKEQLEITMKKGGPLTWGYAITKGDLTLTTPTGVSMKYKRYRGK